LSFQIEGKIDPCPVQNARRLCPATVLLWREKKLVGIPTKNESCGEPADFALT
jgi:hypothetical protein